MNKAILAQAANEARGLAMDAVHKSNSGHLGLPLGAAEVGAVLFGESLVFDPAKPKWLNRDRFILSAGHGSMFIYSWLHLSGYDLSIEEVSNFRQLHSKTPGHPESFETVGVECTTGPLGQGVGNAVGFALSGKRAAAKYNTADHTIFNHHIVALAGDGCLQEGVAREAAAFAAHNGLDNLILIFDSNDVTLDAMAKVTQSENTAAMWTALGWDVITVDGHDIDAVKDAIEVSKNSDNGKPKFIIARTLIGKGIPEVAGTAKGHGEGGAKFVDAAKKGLGLPEGSHFYVSDEVKAYFSDLKAKRAEAQATWQSTFDAWAAANPELKAELDASQQPLDADTLLKLIPESPADGKAATRNSGGEILNHIAKSVPQIITGSADLFGSTKNYIKDGGDFSAENPLGRNIWFGIREHAMGAICNGIAYDGLFLGSGATFLVFADYCRPSIRLAALSKLPVTYIFTHDSVGVGEDGPTHQPVETVSGLRIIPNLDVIRPGDSEEAAAAFAAAFSRHDGPTLLALTRQDIPNQGSASADTRRQGTLKGGYVLINETGELKTILLATGSEVQWAVNAAKELGEGVRVVSMPCFERFDRQSQSYKDEVLPPSVTKRIAIEAGVTALWWKYVGTEGKIIGIDRFGISAPGNTVFKELGITAESVVAAAK
ncbi:transketolase [Phragmitibacter flavus]|uniref:Transketolase n=1 Tax=Phragmitibacter flavus TaxID=2576071 RepID=A0A5R8K9B0_9BACT|nr:transketolase [Phragmitibacter flavus]TLD68904.1 transketolase [Phragmitibacter flavus]